MPATPLLSARRALVACASLAALTSATVATSTAAAAPSPAKSTLQRDADRVVGAGVPGVVALVRHGDRTTVVARGAARLSPHRAVRAGDRFRIASLTKTFMATVVLQLAGEGRLSLDDSVETHLPGMLPDGDAITLRMLLNHRSGLADSFSDPRLMQPYRDGDYAHTWTPEQLVGFATAQPRLFAPGTGESYSNAGYALIGLVVERTTGRSIGEELARRIFRPLGLRSTTFATGQRIAGPHANGYFLPDARTRLDVTAVSPTHAWAAGAIVSTAGDVARFYRTLLSGRLMAPGLLREMLTVTDGYGLGIGRAPTACGAQWGHTGSIAGYESLAWNSKDGRRQVVVLANQSTEDSSVGGPRAVRAYERLVMRAVCGR